MEEFTTQHPAFPCIVSHDVEKLRSYLADGLDPNTLDDLSRKTLLDEAVGCYYAERGPETILLLLENGASRKNCVMMRAMERGREDLLTLLLENGVTPPETKLVSHVLRAGAMGSEKTIKMLGDAGWNLNAKEPGNIQTPLLSAIAHNTSIIPTILKYKVNPNHTNGGFLPLEFAVTERCWEAIPPLIKHGADPHLKRNGLSPFEQAEYVGGKTWDTMVKETRMRTIRRSIKKGKDHLPNLEL